MTHRKDSSERTPLSSSSSAYNTSESTDTQQQQQQLESSAAQEETMGTGAVVFSDEHIARDSSGYTKMGALGRMKYVWQERVWGGGGILSEDREHVLWRDMVAYFVCGLLNNYSYVVMLSAAEDMLEGYAGVVLLFNIVPALMVKLTAPFFMHLIPYNLRIAVVALLSIGSFQFVGWFDPIAMKLFGVTLASLSSGLGEITFLAMSSYYHKDVISAWSSGTGGAGIFGALSYLALTAWFGLTDFMTLMVITVAPMFMFVAAFIIMSGSHSRHGFCSTQRSSSKAKKKKKDNSNNNNNNGQQETTAAVADIHYSDEKSLVTEDLDATIDQEKEEVDGAEDDSEEAMLVGSDLEKQTPVSVSAADLTLKDRIKHLIPLLKYMIPLFLVYYSEYVINQGVAPTITFKRGAIKGKQAYVYYQFLYQAGVFVSRSSVKVFHIRRVWIPAVLQCVNLAVLFVDAYFRIIPSIYIVFVIIFWEGLLGGAAYVNSFYNISIEVQPEFKEFSLGVTSVADSLGVALSGLTSTFLQSWLLAVQRKKPF